MAMEMVQGKLSKRPPSLNTVTTALRPAPMMMPALSAEGTNDTTLRAMPVIPRPIENTPSINWKAISACTRSGPSGNWLQ